MEGFSDRIEWDVGWGVFGGEGDFYMHGNKNLQILTCGIQ